MGVSVKIPFVKYHGTGNDFILTDNRQRIFSVDEKIIAQWCHRRFGIGADGLILIQNHPDFDFEMVYFNADGKVGSMCGNGGRCAVIFARELGIIRQSASFMASDGVHVATIDSNDSVRLSMGHVNGVSANGNIYVLDTGSPHYVSFVDSIKELDVITEGKKIRYSEAYLEMGINVNFVMLKGNGFWMRTYERGVEDETLSCGTGTVAAAIAASVKLNDNNAHQSYEVQALGGNLKVHFTKHDDNHYTEVFLEGPAVKVFEGKGEL